MRFYNKPESQDHINNESNYAYLSKNANNEISNIYRKGDNDKKRGNNTSNFATDDEFDQSSYAEFETKEDTKDYLKDEIAHQIKQVSKKQKVQVLNPQIYKTYHAPARLSLDSAGPHKSVTLNQIDKLKDSCFYRDPILILKIYLEKYNMLPKWFDDIEWNKREGFQICNFLYRGEDVMYIWYPIKIDTKRFGNKYRIYCTCVNAIDFLDRLLQLHANLPNEIELAIYNLQDRLQTLTLRMESDFKYKDDDVYDKYDPYCPMNEVGPHLFPQFEESELPDLLCHINYCKFWGDSIDIPITHNAVLKLMQILNKATPAPCQSRAMVEIIPETWSEPGYEVVFSCIIRMIIASLLGVYAHCKVRANFKVRRQVYKMFSLKMHLQFKANNTSSKDNNNNRDTHGDNNNNNNNSNDRKKKDFKKRYIDTKSGKIFVEPNDPNEDWLNKWISNNKFLVIYSIREYILFAVDNLSGFKKYMEDTYYWFSMEKNCFDAMNHVRSILNNQAESQSTNHPFWSSDCEPILEQWELEKYYYGVSSEHDFVNHEIKKPSSIPAHERDGWFPMIKPVLADYNKENLSCSYRPISVPFIKMIVNEMEKIEDKNYGNPRFVKAKQEFGKVDQYFLKKITQFSMEAQDETSYEWTTILFKTSLIPILFMKEAQRLYETETMRSGIKIICKYIEQHDVKTFNILKILFTTMLKQKSVGVYDLPWHVTQKQIQEYREEYGLKNGEELPENAGTFYICKNCNELKSMVVPNILSITHRDDKKNKKDKYTPNRDNNNNNNDDNNDASDNNNNINNKRKRKQWWERELEKGNEENTKQSNGKKKKKNEQLFTDEYDEDDSDYLSDDEYSDDDLSDSELNEKLIEQENSKKNWEEICFGNKLSILDEQDESMFLIINHIEKDNINIVTIEDDKEEKEEEKEEESEDEQDPIIKSAFGSFRPSMTKKDSNQLYTKDDENENRFGKDMRDMINKSSDHKTDKFFKDRYKQPKKSSIKILHDDLYNKTGGKERSTLDEVNQNKYATLVTTSNIKTPGFSDVMLDEKSLNKKRKSLEQDLIGNPNKKKKIVATNSKMSKPPPGHRSRGRKRETRKKKKNDETLCHEDVVLDLFTGKMYCAKDNPKTKRNQDRDVVSEIMGKEINSDRKKTTLSKEKRKIDRIMECNCTELTPINMIGRVLCLNNKDVDKCGSIFICPYCKKNTFYSRESFVYGGGKLSCGCQAVIPNQKYSCIICKCEIRKQVHLHIHPILDDETDPENPVVKMAIFCSQHNNGEMRRWEKTFLRLSTVRYAIKHHLYSRRLMNGDREWFENKRRKYNFAGGRERPQWQKKIESKKEQPLTFQNAFDTPNQSNINNDNTLSQIKEEEKVLQDSQFNNI